MASDKAKGCSDSENFENRLKCAMRGAQTLRRKGARAADRRDDRHQPSSGLGLTKGVDRSWENAHIEPTSGNERRKDLAVFACVETTIDKIVVSTATCIA